MSESSEPRWDLLPHQPELFFELPEQFDRRDLKRRYNALLRQFKPEKHPEEFQRIRAAFELLDNQLRYGERQAFPQTPGTPDIHWSAAKTDSEAPLPSPPTESDRDAETPRPIKPRDKSPLERLQERLKSESPADVYRQFEEEPNKSPFDYFALAVLSDVVKPEGSQPFLNWLLCGLIKHPSDSGLTRLLSLFLQSDLPDEQLSAITQAVAKAIPNNRFYSLTEPLWDRLLQARPFEQVAQLLAECESLLRDHRLDGKLTFYIHILRAALWVADDAWLNTAFQTLDEHSSELGGRLEYDFEFLLFLRIYREERKLFLNGTAGRDMIDQAMRDYCLKSDYDADHAVLDCQLALATEPIWLRQAFPTTDANFPAWWMLWTWMTADVADRLCEQDADIDPDLLFLQLRKVLRRCEQMTDKSWLSWGWQGLGIVYFGAVAVSLLLVCVPVIAGAVALLMFVLEATKSKGGSQEGLWVLGSVIGSGGTMCYLYFRYLKVRTADRLRRWIAVTLGRQSYQRQWRALIEQHLSLTHQPFRLLIDQLAVEHDDINQVYTSWIHAHASTDYALASLAMAQHFLR
ncbi:MAG: J domain-containing protein [Planctomycetaceae bacterium]